MVVTVPPHLGELTVPALLKLREHSQQTVTLASHFAEKVQFHRSDYLTPY